MKLGRAFLRGLLHAIVALVAAMLVWAMLIGWGIFVSESYNPKFGGPWGDFRFAMMIALFFASVSSGVLLVASIVAHYVRGRIPVSRLVGSSLTFALTSPLVEYGIGCNSVLTLLLIGLPLLSAAWMIEPRQK
ncbi:MAG: hypothetical protein R6X19_01945 [Kiritimatiellia bacterium]